MEQVRPDVRRRDPKKRVQHLSAHSNWQWHLDEEFVKINGETHYLWRAVDHEGEVLESYVTKRRDRKETLKFLRKTKKRFGPPPVIVTDLLRSCGAMKVGGNADRQETGHWKIIEPGIHTHCLAVVCLQATRRGRFDDENARCSGSAACEVCRNSSPYTPQSTTISTKKDIYIHGSISSLTAPPLSPSGANSVRHKATVTGHSETGSHSSDRASVQRLRVHHPEHRGQGVMRRDGMAELQ